MTALALIAMLLLPAAGNSSPNAQTSADISGEWTGTLDVEGIRLRVVIHITKKDDGYSATLDSPDQGAKGIPVEKTTFVSPVLKLELPNITAAYEGKLADGVIDGTWQQGGMSFPLKFSRAP